MKSFRIFIIAVMAIFTAMPAFARNQSSIRTTPLTGPYVGVYGGYNWADVDTAVASPDPEGWDGGIFVGYQFDALFGRNSNAIVGANTAIEAFYGFSNADETTGGVRIEQDDEWGISLRPGLSFLDPVTAEHGINPYGIIGYRNTEFDASGAVTGSERLDGFELGLGTQLLAFGQAGLRFEYSHVWYDSENGIDPDTDNLRLGVSYHF